MGWGCDSIKVVRHIKQLRCLSAVHGNLRATKALQYQNIKVYTVDDLRSTEASSGGDWLTGERARMNERPRGR
jgi:hypothetical protein